jgi:[ribosomal protein S5]-alanine N-acetyltransferase
MGAEIKCKRLTLREITSADFDFLCNLELQPETYFYDKNEPDPKEKTVERYQCYLDKSKDVPASGGLCYVILLASAPEPIGRIYIHCNWELVREWEMGYALLPAHWGKGYAAEAALALAKYAFQSLNVHKLVAFCNVENKRSHALMERIGMKQEGRLREDRWLRNQWVDSFFYSFLRRDLDI